MIPVAALLVLLAVMLVELRVSMANERRLRTMGAVAAPDPVYRVMRLAYPGVFVAMAAEGAAGWWREAGGSWLAGGGWLVAGGAILLLAKLFKLWAVTSLAGRWTYRVFVLPGAPLVTAGPYRWFRHPNYIAVVGELVGFALLVHAPVSGVLGTLGFGELLRRRIRAEEEALEIR